MNVVDQKITPIKANVLQMMNMVLNQLHKCKKSLLEFNKDLAEDVISYEKKINSMDLKIDDECEKVLALTNPVATDLRFILSSLKINTFLERMGDNAEAVAHISNELEKPLMEGDIKIFQLNDLFSLLEEMIEIVVEAFDKEDTSIAIRVFKLDKKVDEINLKANDLMLSKVKSNHDLAKYYLDILSVIRKLERVGDLTKNIAEETIFYVDAKVLKHKKKKKEKLILKQDKKA